MFSIQQWIIPYFFFIFLFSSLLQAQENSKELPKEIIKDTKDPLLQKTEIVKVLTKKDIEKDLPYLSNVLKRVNGIRINESGGIGQNATVLIRGSNNQQIKIYKDGIPIPENRFGFTDFSKISLANVESVEIYKGFVPAYLGSSNMGTAINLITKKNNNEAGVNGNAKITYGSFNSFLFETNISEINTKYQLNFAMDYIDAENDYHFRNDRGTPFNQSDDSNDYKTNNAYQEINLSYDFTRKIDDYNFSFLTNGKNSTQELGGPQNANIKEAKIKFSEISFSTVLKNAYQENLWWETTLFSSVNNNTLLDPLGEIGFSADNTKNTLYSIGSKNYLHWTISESFYTNYLFERKIELNKKIDRLNNQKSYWKRSNYFVTFEPGLKLWHEKLDIKSNLSFLYIDDDVTIFGQEKDESSSNLFNYQLSLKYLSNSNDIFKASMGKIFRAPTLFEQFGDTGLLVGNQQLKEESTIFSEISWERNFYLTKMNLSIDFLLTGFVKSGKDLISYQQISSGIARPFNIEETFISGWESEICIKKSIAELLLQYTFTEAKNKSIDSFRNGKNLPGIPQHQFLAELGIKYKRINWYYRFHYSSKEYFDEINLLYENDRILMDTGISYTTKNWQFSLELKNINDKQYEDFVNYPLPGRSIWFKINYQL